MKEVYIFGDNSLSEILIDYLRLDGFFVSGITLNKRYIKHEEFAGLPVVPVEELLKNKKQSFAVALAIGYNDQNRIREKVYNYLKNSGVEIITYIHKTAVVSPSAQIGEGTIVLENAVIQPRVIIGCSNIIWQGSLISHHSQIGSFNYFAPGSVVLGRTRIGNNVFVGANSTIRNDIDVGNHVIIGANAFVDVNINDQEVFVPKKGQILRLKSSDVHID